MAWNANKYVSQCVFFFQFIMILRSFGSETKRATALAIMNAFGQCFSVLASYLWPTTDASVLSNSQMVFAALSPSPDLTIEKASIVSSRPLLDFFA